VRTSADVGLGDEIVVAGTRFEITQHDHEVLGEQLLHPFGHRRDHADAVDAAVLHTL